MGLKRILAAAALLMCTTAPLHAQQPVNKFFNLYGEKPFAPAYNRTSAPIGFVEFCKRHASECVALNGRTAEVKLDPHKWGLINDVNTHVNASVAPVSDDDLYNTVEHWTYPSIAGDCEDYVLLKKRYLEGLGIPAETLLITVVLDEDRQGHAVLMIKTDTGDYVLDNRRDEIRAWSDTGYKFLKRQSQRDPRVWVSLTAKDRSIRKKRHYGRN